MSGIEVYSTTIKVMEHQLVAALECIREDLERDEDESILSLQSVRDNKELKEYICDVIAHEGHLFNAFECWQADGFMDWRQYI